MMKTVGSSIRPRNRIASRPPAASRKAGECLPRLGHFALIGG